MSGDHKAPLFTIDSWLVAWNPARAPWADLAEKRGGAPGEIKVGPWPDYANWSIDL